MSARAPISGSAWCLGCGRPVTEVIESLDPDHPIVVCRPSSGHPGCGRTLGTRLEADFAVLGVPRGRRRDEQ